ISNNTAATTYVDDALGRVQNISQAGSGASTKEVVFAYYNNSQVQTVATYPNDLLSTVASYDYDGDGRLTSLSYTGPGTTITTLSGSAISYGLEYDPAGNIMQATSADGTDNYGLNDDNELTSASLTSESYQYDQNGNRTESGYQTGAGNRLLADGPTTYTYQYDADGNRTVRTAWSCTVPDYLTNYSYDQQNRLIDVISWNFLGEKTSEVQYTYDYAGRLIRTATDATGSGKFTYTYTVYDGENAYLQVSDPNGLANTPSSATISQRYLYGPAVDQILATDNGAGTVLWGLADFEGTIRDVVNSSGKEVANGHIQFSSFGTPINGTTPVLTGFLFGLDGMRYDPVTGDYLTESVFYDPSDGQRLSQDPLGFESGTTNFTAWAGNSPVENVDPSGECTTTYSPGTVFQCGASYPQSTMIDANTPPATYGGFGQSVANNVFNNYIAATQQAAGDAAVNDIAGMTEAWSAQQKQQAAVQQQQISELQNYAYKLGTARSAVSSAYQQANAAAASAWFPSSIAAAGDQAIQAQTAGNQLDAQIEQFRQYLLANPTYAQAVFSEGVGGGSDLLSTLSSQSSLSQTLIGNANCWNALIHEPGSPSCADPFSVAVVTIMTAGMGSPLVAGTSSSMAGSAGAGTTASIIGAEARPIISQYVAGVGIDATGGLVTDSTLAPMATSTLGSSSTSFLAQSLSTSSPYIANGVAGNILANIAASQAANGSSNFAIHLGIDAIYQNAAIAVETAGDAGLTNQFGLLGTYAHQEFAWLNELASQDLEGTGVRIVTEQFRNAAGDVVPAHTLGSKSLDAFIEVDGSALRGFDLKTGEPWAQSTLNVIQQRFQVPVTQIRIP
ncbi:MAG: RHS repeat domain-containing protein, partial [Thermoguttaceae bacterium]